MSIISIKYTHHNFNEVFPFNVFWMCPVINLLCSVVINWSHLSPNNKKVVDCESVVCYIVEDQEKEWKINTVVSNHFHSVKILLFSSARSRDFDGLIGNTKNAKNSKSDYSSSGPLFWAMVTYVNQFNTACVKYTGNIHPLIINYHAWIRPGTYI
jgi:hypothetical protein